MRKPLPAGRIGAIPAIPAIPAIAQWTGAGGEATVQRAVFAHFTWRSAADVFAFHVPNGGARRRVEAAILKACGVVAGVPDVIAVKGGRVFGLELKTAAGRLSAAQRATHEAMRAAGAVVGVAAGLDEALAWLESHGLLRGAAEPRCATGLAGARSRAPASECPEPVSSHGRPALQAG